LADRALAPDFNTIADFRKDNGKVIREICREFVALCRKLDLPRAASAAIDGSKFKAVNAGKELHRGQKMRRRPERIDESTFRYLSQLRVHTCRRFSRFSHGLTKLGQERNSTAVSRPRILRHFRHHHDQSHYLLPTAKSSEVVSFGSVNDLCQFS
jgi:hypothetical protein